MILFAHAGHWLTGIAYFVPVIGFVAWMLMVQRRERRAERKQEDASEG